MTTKGSLFNPHVEHTDSTPYAPFTPVYSLNGKVRGHLTGGSRVCRLSGCIGRSLGVRWPNGKLTWCCTKGMTWRKKSWRIG